MLITNSDIKSYRIKTKEEFEKEFEKSWRTMSGGFTHRMDSLLGKHLLLFNILNISENGILIEDKLKNNWMITYKMITKSVKKKKSVQWF